MFSWVHGTAVFQLCFDTISFIIAKNNIKLHCYIDDCIAVIPKAETDAAFQSMCALLQDLDLSLNWEKLTPRTKKLSLFGD